jgi:uncharacterized repeat protein (TIGR02543 family)
MLKGKVMNTIIGRRSSLVLSVVIALLVLLAFTPLSEPSYAAATDGQVNLSQYGDDIVITSDDTTVTAETAGGFFITSAPVATGIVLTGTSSSHGVSVYDDAGRTFNITLYNVTINSSKPFEIRENATCNLNITGNNILVTADGSFAALSLSQSSEAYTSAERVNLNISGSGSLVCSAMKPEDAGAGAGIGTNRVSTNTYGGNNSINGDISISSGVVTVSSGYGAGIGTGAGDHHGPSEINGDINISGGIINAFSKHGAGIGTGFGDSYYGEYSTINGNINITGGIVNAQVDQSMYIASAGIGTGVAGTINGNVNISGANIVARGGKGSADIGTGAGGIIRGSLFVSGSDIDAPLIGSTGGTIVGQIIITLTPQITFDKKDGDTLSFLDKTVEYGGLYGELPVATRKGYDFIGWYNDDEKLVRDNSTVNITSSHTLHAHWQQKKFKVNFNANGGKVLSRSTEVYYDALYRDLPIPTRNGHKFKGWYTKKIGGTKITSNSKVSITKATTLYAHWAVKKYTVKFNVNGGKKLTAVKIKKVVTYNKSYGKLTTPTKKGYKFTGWYTYKIGGKKITTSGIVKITKTTTYYAHWKRK